LGSTPKHSINLPGRHSRGNIESNVVQIVQHNRECKSVTDGFDYSVVDDADMVALLKEATTKIRACRRQAASSIIEIGKQLTAVKQWLGHGPLGPWLQAEFDWNERTAQRYMRVAEVFGDKTDTVSDLEPTTLYLLSSRSTPEMVLGNSIAKLESGEHLDHHQLLTEIQEARRAKAQAEAEAKLAPRQRRQRAKERQQQQQHRGELNKELARMREAEDRAIAILIEHLDPEALKEFIACLRISGMYVDKLEQAQPRMLAGQRHDRAPPT
jgi:Protein of unknown function (DUF3102)